MLSRAILLLHHHEGGVLGQRFRHHVRAFHAPADQLVRPPLVAELMRGDEVGEVDVGGLFEPADEADAFGERNGVGKRLRESAVARKLQNAELRELEGTEDSSR